MRSFINVLTLFGVILAFLNIGQLMFGLITDGFSEGRGMAILFFQLWAAIGAFFALIFGFIGRALDNRKKIKVSSISLLGIAVGFVGGIAVLGLSYF
jgi:hypothetical protein